MKKLTVLGFSALLVLGLVAMAGAHKPEGEQYFAFQFLDESVPNMDGDLSDWSFIPDDPYSITNPELFSPAKSIRDVGRGEMDPSEVNIWHRLGYNANNEFLYFATQIFDDFHDIDRENLGHLWRDDSIEIRINPSAVLKAEQNVDGEPINFINYHFAVPPLEGVYEGGGAPDWIHDGSPYLSFGWSATGEAMGAGGSTYVYEMGTMPVAALGEGPEDTEFFDMEEGEVIHFNITMPDVDCPAPCNYNGFWAVSPGPDNNPEVDLVLAPLEEDVMQTAVEDVSWGMIKAGLSE